MEDGNVDYISFCDDVETVFKENVDVKEILTSEKSQPQFTPEEEQKLSEILAKIREIVATSRILLKPIF